jgi:hypothetical protein
MTDHTELRRLAESATPGPWTALGTGVRGGDHWYIVADDEAIAYVSANDGSDEAERQPRAEFIAAANPSTVLALLDEIAALQARIDDALAWMDAGGRLTDHPLRRILAPTDKETR